jgi:hypothetical protein
MEVPAGWLLPGPDAGWWWCYKGTVGYPAQVYQPHIGFRCPPHRLRVLPCLADAGFGLRPQAGKNGQQQHGQQCNAFHGVDFSGCELPV